MRRVVPAKRREGKFEMNGEAGRATTAKKINYDSKNKFHESF